MFIPPGWKLPEAIKKRLGTRVGRQRVMFEDEHTLIILHKVPQANQVDREAVVFWRDAEGVWKHTDRGSGLIALKEHVETYAKAVEDLDDMQDNAKSAIDFLKILETAAPLQRAAKHLYQVLEETRNGMKEVKEIIEIRDLAYEVSRAAELVHGDTRSGLDCAIMLRSEEQAKASQKMSVTAHRLNVLAAIFLL